MEGNEQEAHFVKRVTLPSGRTIEVVYFREPEPKGDESRHPPAEPDQRLHVCIECSSKLVYPERWTEAGPENWSVLLHCPDCDVYREGVFSQATVEAYDEEIDRAGAALEREYERLVKENMSDETERFVRALEADAILPEDF